MRIRSRVWTAPDGSCGSDDESEEGFEEKEGGRFLMPLLAAALDAERNFEAENETKLSQKKKISENVHGNRWRDLLVSRKDSNKEDGARFKEWEIQNRGMRSLRYGIVNPEKKEKVVSTPSTSSSEEHDLLSICPRRCSPKQKQSRASASNPQLDIAESRKCSIDLQRSKKRKANTRDSAGRKKPKVRKIEIAEVDTRCKRRNGKGWRCFGTRVGGYSLCEHHLRRTQTQPSKNKKPTRTKENVLDARSGFHALPAVEEVRISAQQYADDYEHNKARRIEMEFQVKKQRKKKKSLEDINLVLDHYHHHDHHPHLIRDFTFELRESWL